MTDYLKKVVTPTKKKARKDGERVLRIAAKETEENGHHINMRGKVYIEDYESLQESVFKHVVLEKIINHCYVDSCMWYHVKIHRGIWVHKDSGDISIMKELSRKILSGSLNNKRHVGHLERDGNKNYYRLVYYSHWMPESWICTEMTQEYQCSINYRNNENKNSLLSIANAAPEISVPNAAIPNPNVVSNAENVAAVPNAGNVAAVPNAGNVAAVPNAEPALLSNETKSAQSLIAEMAKMFNVCANEFASNETLRTNCMNTFLKNIDTAASVVNAHLKEQEQNKKRAYLVQLEKKMADLQRQFNEARQGLDMEITDAE